MSLVHNAFWRAGRVLIGQWGLEEWCGTESLVVQSSLQTASPFIYLVIDCDAMQPLSERSLGVVWVWFGCGIGLALWYRPGALVSAWHSGIGLAHYSGRQGLQNHRGVIRDRRR